MWLLGVLLVALASQQKKRMSLSKGKLTTIDHQILDTNATKKQFKLPQMSN